MGAVPRYLAVHEAAHAVAACVLYPAVGHEGWPPFSWVFVRTRNAQSRPYISRKGAKIMCQGMLVDGDFYKPVFRKIWDCGLPPEAVSAARARMEAGGVVSLAGPFAEARQRRISRAAAMLSGGASDWGDVQLTTAEFCRDDGEQRSLVAKLELRTTALLQEHWRAIQAVAAALMEKRSLTSGQVYRIMKTAR